MIFIVIIIGTLLLTLKYADWKNWRTYQSSMLLIILGNLLYGFVYHDRFLWKFNPDILNSHGVELIITFTVFPLTAIMFLSNFPVQHNKILLKISKYILVYIAVEILLSITGMIEFDYGWNIIWSLAWDCIMFTILAIHFKKPIQAYGLCALVAILMNRIFPFMLE
jgi:hypothetical protein